MKPEKKRQAEKKQGRTKRARKKTGKAGEERKTPQFTLQSLMLFVLFSGGMLTAMFFMLREFFQGLQVLLDPLLRGETAQLLPQAAGARLADVAKFLEVQQGTLPLFVVALGGFVTVLLWFGTQVMVRTMIRSLLAYSGFALLAERELQESKKQEKQEKPDAGVQPTRKLEPVYSPEAALQVLALLQQQGRFIDFLEEDLGSYEDAQIGAAVRSIHEGCKKALHEHLELKPVFEQEEEGAQVTVKQGFDSSAIRLTGNVSGDPPFRGVLRHRGWRVVKADFPQPVSGRDKPVRILAPAEVEMEG